MPTASNKARAAMEKWFGTVDDAGPSRFLLARGWFELGGLWRKPVESYNPSSYEVDCVLFLRDEWDHDFVRPLFQPSDAGY